MNMYGSNYVRIIFGSSNIKLLSVKKNNELKFEEQISNICLKANRIIEISFFRKTKYFIRGLHRVTI